MTPERYKEVGELYRAALEVDAERRAVFLAETCGGDEALRQEVESLLGYREQGGLIDQPALEVAAQALANASTMAVCNREIGHYRLLSLLGAGGMGEVHLAQDTRLQRKVAVKLLPAEFTTDGGRVRRFEQEARAASALNHPNIITVHEIGDVSSGEGSTHYIVTEYVEGETLRQRLLNAPDNRLPVAEAVEITEQIAAALTAAHETGIAHRDIKPENVMMRRDGIVKVLDFGLAKLTESATPNVDSQASTPTRDLSTEAGLVLGTPRYMSPEQARGEKVDARTDIFSLGVMLYEMVAGRAPFAGSTPGEVIAAILRDDPPPFANSTSAPLMELERIVDRALQKDRAARYQRMEELLGELKRLKRRMERQDELEDERALAGQATLMNEGAAPSDDGKAPPTKTMKSSVSTGDVAPTVTTKKPPIGGIGRRRIAFGAFMLALVALAAVVYFNSFSGGGQTIDSLAVLPFVNVGGNPDTEYLSDGIADSLINRLSQSPNLKVMSRNSVFRYKDKETDAQQAGKSLGVRAVLTGKVILRGSDLIISAELVDVRDNSHLWGEQYDHKLTDLLATPAELARDISQQLRLKLSNEAQKRLAKRDTENPEAYPLYLKGRYALNTFEGKKLPSALQYFQQALEKDPRFALAYAGMAEVYSMMGGIGTTFRLPPKEAYPLAKAAALKAIEIDDMIAEAHSSLGNIALKFEWDWAGAEREFKRAIALKPDLVPAHHLYSHYLIAQGRFDESLTESLRGLALDPLDVTMNFHLGDHYLRARQLDQASAQLQKTLTMNPSQRNTHSILGMVYAQQGRYREAIAELQKSFEPGSADGRGLLAYVYAISGRRDEAKKLLVQLQEEAKSKVVSACNIARIYAGLGEKEQAFAWLEKAITERDSNLTQPGLKVDFMFDSLRSDPRFTDLLRRMGLSQ